MARTAFHIYPDPLQRGMRSALARYTGLEPESLIVGAGSDELIDLLFRLFISPGDVILDFDPTFAMYGFCARVADAEVRLVPRDELFEIDIDAVREAIDSKTKIIFISSPNNPTGNLASEAQVRSLLETGLVVVVDEAYYEFCGQTAAGMVPEHENLVVLRSMSKWAGLAGLRVGYGIMSPSVVKHIVDVKSPYNVSVASEAALIASLEDADTLLKTVKKIVAERAIRRYVDIADTQLAPGRAQEVYDGLAARGIFVRNFPSERLRDCFRISVGTSDHTDVLVAALRELV